MLFEETRRNAEAVCAQASREPALLDRCEEATEFLSLFPECEASCEELVRAHRRRPTR